ncbi:MAG: DUF2784 domain-containing protein [Desulforhopalus sp.]|nr:DUF2784 domain-containing protein [Desulforhopalus sp.]
MLHRILADLVVLVHLFFIIFVVTGGFAAYFWSWRLILLHLPAAVWGVYIEFSGNICPLTPLENYLRQLAGQEGYSAGFVEHYLVPVIYPVGLTREIQVVLGLFVLVVNLAAYAFILRRIRTQRS